ncbi:PAN domain-containing protein [Planoprotostelium fungivorum]|uniref:PAN domain-containing protein n=1 Tax=Planoprotostelium fungivorum TaxID=1890364 RepID=A0A2P6NPR4_9EUKA|nr:PAN domain-containing protein [Planoprotostelium fungivorum]
MRQLTLLSLFSLCLLIVGAKPSSHGNHAKRADSPVDWRDRKVLGQVGVQGQCNSDWAFAISSAMSSCIAITISIDPIELSKQQLQDCTASRKCLSSNASVSDALEWIRTSGLSVDPDYPYTQSDGQCHNTAYRWSFTTASTGSSEEDMSTMLAAGPVIVTYNGDALKSYTGGVLSNITNSSSAVDSVGLLVGWSSDCASNVTQCWIIRTSKGSTWGESGHFRVEKGKGLMSLGASSQLQKCYIMSLPGSYGYLEAVDRIGGEMNKDIFYPALNGPECQKLCFRAFDCNAWAFDTCNNKCYLKSQVPATTTVASCRMSGVITSPRVTSYDGAYGLIERGDRPGADLGDAIVALSADDCQGRCFGSPQCNAWAFDTCGNRCWLKGSSGNLDTSITCRASGVITAKRNNRNGPYGPMEYTDRVGIDLLQSNATSAEDCQLQCFKHPQCLVWSFETCGKRCWLKQKSSGTEANNCRVSGPITSKKGDRNTNLGPIEWMDRWDTYYVRNNDVIDRPGGDLGGAWTANSADDCQNQCNNHPQCTVWAYDACGNQCWLKQSTTGPESRDCRQSGTIPGKRGGRNTNLGPIEYVDRVGADIGDSRRANSPEDCQSQCQNTGPCVAWAFDTCGNRCWLKSSTSGTVAASCRASGTVNKQVNYPRGLTLVNNCDHSIRMCGDYAAYVFDMPARSSRFMTNTGNPAYNQCNSVQVEVKFNQWNNLDWYDFSEVAIKWSGDPVKLIPPRGLPVLYCTHRDCPDAYQWDHDDLKTHSVPTGGAFVAQWC